MSHSVYNIPLNNIQGQATDLNQYQGKVLLLVNVASKCGLTPQYEGLESLYQAKKQDGLEILGFPANNFLEQEPGSNEEIQQFCANFLNSMMKHTVAVIVILRDFYR